MRQLCEQEPGNRHSQRGNRVPTMPLGADAASRGSGSPVVATGLII